MNTRCVFIGAIAAGASVASAFPIAATWDELSDGDLAGDFNTGLPWLPSDLGTLGLGVNWVEGSVGDSLDLDFDGAFDGDAFEFVIPAGYEVDSILLYDLGGLGASAHVGIAVGAGIVNDFFAPAPGNELLYLGTTDFTAGSPTGAEIIDDLGAALGGGTGFVGPLGAGSYTIGVLDTQGPNPPFSVNNYRIEITLVPAPASALCVLAGAPVVARRKR